jgi:hypothetical protein
VTTLVTAPDTTARDAIMAALATLAPYGVSAWGVLPVGTVGDLLRDPGDAEYIRRAWVAQRQDGGALDAYAGLAGWRGLYIVRGLAATDALARDARTRADAVMQALVGVRARRLALIPPYEAPDADGIYSYAYQYEVRVT